MVGDVVKRLDAPVQPTMYFPLLDGDWRRSYIMFCTPPATRIAWPPRHATNQCRWIATYRFSRSAPWTKSSASSAQNREFSVLLLGLFAALGAGLGGGRLVWRPILYRLAADGRDRHSHGVGRALAGRAPHGAGAGYEAGAGRYRRRIDRRCIRYTRLLSGLLFGIGAGDPLTFASVPLVLLAVAAIACLIPAMRATRIDPTLALRRE